MPKLSDVIQAYVSPDKDTSLKSALSGVEDLEALTAEAEARSDELAAKDEKDLTDEDVAELQHIASVLKSVRAVKKEQAAAKAAAESEAVAAQKRAEQIAEAKTAISDLGKAPEKAVEAKVEDQAPEQVAEVNPPQESAAVPIEPTEIIPADAGKELVGAGVGSVEQFSVSSLRASGPPKSGSLMGQPLTRMFASSQVEGRAHGSKFDDMTQVAEAVMSAWGTKIGGQGKTKIAEYRRPELEEFSVWGANQGQDEAVIDRVASNIPVWDPSKGQFAVGWCAPSETDYELCPFLTSMDGIWNVPEVVARRGGVFTNTGPDFATLFANAAIGQVLTEAQVIAETEKICIEIDCPPFTETRLDVNPLCVTGNLLATAGYPEYTERFIRMAMAANAHKISLNMLLRAVAASTAVTLPGATGPVDTSSLSWFLDAASLYATWLRDRYRLQQDQLIEVVAPYWYYQQMLSDVTRRNGVDLLVADARIRAAFAERNIRVQWVYNWQPMAATAAGAAARPTSAQILVYIPGTYLKITAPVINLGVVHSAAQLAVNQYTALFVEDGFNLIERCFDSLVITVPTCPSGTTGAASGSCDSTP